LELDELNTPLGRDKKKGLLKLPAGAPRILAGLLGLFVIAAVAWAIFVNDPLGGEPSAVVATGSRAATGDAVTGDVQQHTHHDALTNRPSTVNAPPIDGAIPPPGSKTVTIIDGTSGKRQDVTIPAWQ
jgi:hypothetical protein